MYTEYVFHHMASKATNISNVAIHVAQKASHCLKQPFFLRIMQSVPSQQINGISRRLFQGKWYLERKLDKPEKMLKNRDGIWLLQACHIYIS